MKKKLAILSNSLAGGGAERVISYLIEGLRGEYDLVLVLMEEKIVYDIPKDVPVHFLDKAKREESGIIKLFKLPYMGWKYKQYCKKNHIEISLAFMNRPSYISIFAKWFGGSAKTIISERSTPSKLYAGTSLLSRTNRFLIRKLYPWADLIIANSQGGRHDLVEKFKIDPSIIKVLYNLLDIEKIKELSQAEIHLMNVDRFTYITIGRLDDGKNHRLLIDAFFKVKDKSSQLLIIGEGPRRKALEEQIARLKLEKRVFLLGFDANPYRHMSKADVFVLTSNYEGFPNVVLEAMACGLPVISTDCESGPREILAPQSDTRYQTDTVEMAKYGILTPVGDLGKLKEAMQLMLCDEVVAKKYQEQSYMRAKDFDKSINIVIYAKVLRE